MPRCRGEDSALAPSDTTDDDRARARTARGGRRFGRPGVGTDPAVPQQHSPRRQAGVRSPPAMRRASVPGPRQERFGRHLHDHRFVTVLGTIDEAVKNFVRPGHSVATLDHVHGARIPWGGGFIVDPMSLLPLTAASDPAMPDVPLWGAGHQEWIRGRPPACLRHLRDAAGDPDGLIASEARGRPSRPVGQTGRRTAQRRARGIRRNGGGNGRGRRAGAGGGWGAPDPPPVRRGNRLCVRRSLVRLRADGIGPSDIRHGPMRTRVHGTKRVIVCDASLPRINSTVNPALTIVAKALRSPNTSPRPDQRAPDFVVDRILTELS